MIIEESIDFSIRANNDGMCGKVYDESVSFIQKNKCNEDKIKQYIIDTFCLRKEIFDFLNSDIRVKDA